jgi:hypothetical protein
MHLSSNSPKVTLQPLVAPCATGECPTIFQADRGTLVLQRYVFNPDDAGAEVPPGEQMIEVPVALLAKYARMTS